VPRVLVADDNSNIQKMVTLALEERGVDVVAVGNGEAAVRRLADVNPDLVLADVFMPVRNGYEVCEYVKKDARFSHVPVILLVGAFDPLDEKEARRVGADGVLKKPFVPPDPLIAMVMQVLEKNPRIAAEIARQKEVIAEPPPQPEALEVPLRAEPKPLPEFPEPTPEEAAAIYGFGKGVRALAGDDPEADEEEYSTKSKSSKAPKAPVASVEADEDFENAATASDWRRNAADFEVPENVAQDPVEPFDSESVASAFPSENDVPPRHIRSVEIADEEEASQNVAKKAPVSASDSIETPVQRAEDIPAPAARFDKISASEDAPQTSHALWLSDPEPAPAPALAATAPALEAKEPVREETRDEWRAKAEPVLAPVSRATEWMDMMAPPPSEYPDGGWMSNLTSPATSASTQVEPEAPGPATHTEASSDNHGAASGPVAVAQPVETSHKESEVESFLAPADRGERFFAESADRPRSSYHFPSDESHETAHNVEEAMPDPEPSSAPELANDLVVAPADAEHREDDSSEHPTPEPLLVDEEHSDPSEYSPIAEQPEPAPAQHILPASVEAQNEQPDALMEQHLDSSVFEPAPEAASLEEFSERIPTLPPANREALAGIPFLMPPPVSDEVAAKSDQADADRVDALVRKVMEKLRPQLQDLFSQGVKPLVENLVHSELAKKDR
jgi:CheY-like chemotaxis protein